jgi:hypothetical protein
MADIMTLDLSGAGGDDGLLVPFSRPFAPTATPKQNETESLFNSNSNHSNSNRRNNNRQGSSNRGFGGFFRRNNFDKEAAEEERRKNLPLKTTTFAFPKAHVEQAEIPEPPLPKKEKQPQDESEESSSGEEDDSDDEYETDEDDEAPKPSPNLKKMDEWDPTQNPYYEERQESRPWRVEGFGTTPVATQEKKPKGIGGFFSRFGRNNSSRHGDDDLRTMRVATEDTKDQKSMAEHVAKAALVVLIPELYADDEEGDGNLGMYRSLSTATDEDAGARRQAQSRNVAMTNEVGGMRMSSALGGGLRLVHNGSLGDDPSIVLRNEVRQLRLKVAKLDKALKSAQLEAGSWKLRCKELKTEMRRYNGKSDDDSSIEVEEDSDNEEESDEEDDGIEEEWTGYDSVKVGNLLEIPAKEENPAFDPLMTETKEDENEGNLLDIEEPDESSLLYFQEKAVAPPTEDAPSMIDMSVKSVEEPSLLDFQETTTPEAETSPDLLELPEEPKPIGFDPLQEKTSTESPELVNSPSDTTATPEVGDSRDLLELPEEPKPVVFYPLKEDTSTDSA